MKGEAILYRVLEWMPFVLQGFVLNVSMSLLRSASARRWGSFSAWDSSRGSVR